MHEEGMNQGDVVACYVCAYARRIATVYILSHARMRAITVMNQEEVR